jgi:Mg2+/Co2+ transporter CorB
MEPQLDVWIPWPVATAVISLLMAIGAFFSIAETALTSSSRPRLTTLANDGDARARRVLALHDRQEVALSAILLGNNLVNILASAIATGWLIDLFGEAGVAYAALAMTVLTVVFGEVLPKTVGLGHADRVILAIEPLVTASVRVLSPLSRAVQWIVTKVLTAFGHAPRPRPAEQDVRAEEELRGAIELHAAPDPGVKVERAMLRSILDLGEVAVSRIMVHRNQVVAIDIGQKPTEVLEQALSSPHTRIPVFRGSIENIVGVLHAKALLQALRAVGGRAELLDIAQVMARPWFIPDSTTLLDQLQAFRRRREHFALVVDEYGTLQGIVTLEDILEEIVGDMAERHEFKVPGVRLQADGSWLIDGTVTLRDLNREFDWRLPDDPASTVAGLVLHEARVIPDVGQAFVFHGLRFEILRRKRNQIVLLRVSRFPSASEALAARTTGAAA